LKNNTNLRSEVEFGQQLAALTASTLHCSCCSVCQSLCLVCMVFLVDEGNNLCALQFATSLYCSI